MKRIVPLSQVLKPVAPGTLAFSIRLATPDCKEHLKAPSTFLKHTGTVLPDGEIDLGERTTSYSKLYEDHRTFRVTSDSVTEAHSSMTLSEGDLVAAFGIGCGCRVNPFRLTSFGWPTTKGITAEPIGSPGVPADFSPYFSAWLVVLDGWNEPVEPEALKRGENVLLFDLRTSSYERQTFSEVTRNGTAYVRFAKGTSLGREVFGTTRLLYRQRA